MNNLVKMITDDDENEYPNSFWHLYIHQAGGPRTLCTGECFGTGEGSATYKTKSVKRGGITCPECLAFIHNMKSIKL